MTVVLTHLFKLLSFFINICCFLLVYLYLITYLPHLKYCDSAFKNLLGLIYAVVHQLVSKSSNSFTDIW